MMPQMVGSPMASAIRQRMGQYAGTGDESMPQPLPGQIPAPVVRPTPPMMPGPGGVPMPANGNTGITGGMAPGSPYAQPIADPAKAAAMQAKAGQSPQSGQPITLGGFIPGPGEGAQMMDNGPMAGPSGGIRFSPEQQTLLFQLLGPQLLQMLAGRNVR